MAQRDNLIATYQSNPTLQSRYTQDQYLDLFGFGANQPQPDPTPTPTPTPPSDGIENIIGQNLNQGGGGGRPAPENRREGVQAPDEEGPQHSL